MSVKVFVSGCFDMLHSGHIAFLRSAARYGELHVAIGSDRTVFDLKGRTPVNSEEERRFMVQALECVASAFISSGSGILDFEPEFCAQRPDVLVVNEDGDLRAKRLLCEELGVRYVVEERTPHGELQARSTTQLRTIDRMPYRIDLAGGWLDQPFVSRHCPGSVITVGLEPTIEFNERSGMASSTRRRAIELWGSRMPAGDFEHLAEVLFCYDNPPGTETVSGSQDSIGLVFPGLAKADYDGEYWPTQITHHIDPRALDFVENALHLKPLGPRGVEYDVLADTNINEAGGRSLAEATAACWEAILTADITRFGGAVRASFEAQIAMFPNMVTPLIQELIDEHAERALGWKLSGAGGGGYLILVSDEPVEHAIRVAVRRRRS